MKTSTQNEIKTNAQVRLQKVQMTKTHDKTYYLKHTHTKTK